MSNTVIKFSRPEEIVNSYEVAIIKLNQFNHKVGQPVAVRYYSDKVKNKVNTVLAIGKAEGPGKDNFEIVSNGRIEPLTGAYNTRLPDVSNLVNNQVYLCYSSFDQPALCIIGENNKKSYVPITEDRTFYSAMDGFYWFVTRNKIRRSDDIVDSGLLTEVIQGLLDEEQIHIDTNKKIYEWKQRPDGIVSDGSKYARIFNIPPYSSVTMQVSSRGPFGTLETDIITFSSAEIPGPSGYTSGIKQFYVAGERIGPNGVQSRGVVIAAHPSSSPYGGTFKFTVLSSTCKEEDIEWFSGVGFSGEVGSFTGFGTKNSPESAYPLYYDTIGKVSVDSSSHFNFLADASKCKGKKLTTTFTGITDGSSLFKFFIKNNISGFRIIDPEGTVLVDIDRELFSGSIINVSSRVFRVNRISDWNYNVTESEIYSSDGSVSISTAADGRKDLSVAQTKGSEEFWFYEPAGIPKHVDGDAEVYDWVQILNIQGGDWPSLPHVYTDFGRGIDLQVKGYHGGYVGSSAYLSGLVTIQLDMHNTSDQYPSGNVHINSTSWQFSKLIHEGIEFAGECDTVNKVFKLYFRPTLENTNDKTYGFKVMSTSLDWSYASPSFYPSERNEYINKNSYIYNPDTRITRFSGIMGKTTDTVTAGNTGLITSGGVYEEIRKIGVQMGTDSGKVSNLETRVQTLEDTELTAAKINNSVVLPEELEYSGETYRGLDLGEVYTPENTYRVQETEVIDGEIVGNGSLVHVNSRTGEKTVVSKSSLSKVYEFTANTLEWWSLGRYKEGNPGILRVTLSGEFGKICGDIYLGYDNTYVTTNPRLVGFIKTADYQLVIQGSEANPITVTIEDYFGTLVYYGTKASYIKTANTYSIWSSRSSLCRKVYQSSMSIKFTGNSFYDNDGSEFVIPVKLKDKKITYSFSNSSNKFKTSCLNFRVLAVVESVVIEVKLDKTFKITIDLPQPNRLYTVTFKQDDLIWSYAKDEGALAYSDLGQSVESISNKTATINELSTDKQYPTAKAVWDKFKGNFSREFTFTTACDVTSREKYQAALKITTPAILDVSWTTAGVNGSDTIYVNGISGRPGTYNLRTHNNSGVFSLGYDNGDFYICVPALPSPTSVSTTYRFITSMIGTGEEMTDTKFFGETKPSVFVGQELESSGGIIYNLEATTVDSFSFKDYDTVIITKQVPGNEVSIKNLTTGTLPIEDRVYTIINSSGRDLTSLYVEGKDTNGTSCKIGISDIQAGATITLAYVTAENRFSYGISLQSFISPDSSITMEKKSGQWQMKVSQAVLDKKQDKLDFDPTPTEGSDNLVTSGDIYDYVNSLKDNEVKSFICYGNDNPEFKAVRILEFPGYDAVTYEDRLVQINAKCGDDVYNGLYIFDCNLSLDLSYTYGEKSQGQMFVSGFNGVLFSKNSIGRFYLVSDTNTQGKALYFQPYSGSFGKHIVEFTVTSSSVPWNYAAQSPLTLVSDSSLGVYNMEIIGETVPSLTNGKIETRHYDKLVTGWTLENRLTAFQNGFRPKVLNISKDSIGKYLLKASDCELNSRYEKPANKTGDKYYILVLDKEYDFIVYEYYHSGSNVPAKEFYNKGFLKYPDGADDSASGDLMVVMAVPCGVVTGVKQSDGTYVPPIISNGINSFTNGYSFKSIGLNYATSYSDDQFLYVINQGHSSSKSMIYNQYVHWNSRWYNPLGY